MALDRGPDSPRNPGFSSFFHPFFSSLVFAVSRAAGASERVHRVAPTERSEGEPVRCPAGSPIRVRIAATSFWAPRRGAERLGRPGCGAHAARGCAHRPKEGVRVHALAPPPSFVLWGWGSGGGGDSKCDSFRDSSPAIAKAR